MTEQEYINVKELAFVQSAIAVLSQIVPVSSKVIPVSGHQDMMKQLSIWQEKLFDRVTTP